jgi:hypothetical protein
MTNTLAFYENPYITAVKCFTMQALERVMRAAKFWTVFKVFNRQSQKGHASMMIRDRIHKIVLRYILRLESLSRKATFKMSLSLS